MPRTRPARGSQSGSAAHKEAASPPMASRSCSRTRYSQCARGGTDRSYAPGSASSWPRRRPSGPVVGSGSITRRRRSRRPAGAAIAISATSSSGNGSSNTGPTWCFSGHVHQSPFVKEGSWVDRIGPTWVFNAGQQFGAPPTHIVIDTEEEVAFWFSAAGNQFVRLDRAARAAGAATGSAAPLAQSRGSASASGPDVNSSLCWWMSVSSTSPTMPKWLPCPSNCRLRSTR